jgi:large subunit ribosomal protein L25
MQQFKLNIVNREGVGRGVARRLRAEGNIPACVYSKGNSRSIALSLVDFRELSREMSGADLVELVDEQGAVALARVQEVQRNAVKNCITHVDFLEVPAAAVQG